MRLFAAVTDNDWFALHASRDHVEELNFWRPSPEAGFKALRPAELLLFKLHAPMNFIAGGGCFVRFHQLPVNLAWETFGEANGVRSLEEMRRRLRDVLQSVRPRPTVLGYVINRVDEGLILYTVTAKQVGKREVALLCAGQWPCWEQIIRAVPEFDGTQVAFDAVSRHEWCRRWGIRLQEDRLRAEHGIFS